MGTRDSKIQDDEDVDVLRSPVHHRKSFNLQKVWEDRYLKKWICSENKTKKIAFSPISSANTTAVLTTTTATTTTTTTTTTTLEPCYNWDYTPWSNWTDSCADHGAGPYKKRRERTRQDSEACLRDGWMPVVEYEYQDCDIDGDWGHGKFNIKVHRTSL